MKKWAGALIRRFFGKDLDLRIKLFHVLAITGTIVSIITTAVSAAGGFPVTAVINAFSGVVSLGLLIYSAKSGRYQFCYAVTIVCIFFVLFSSIFVTGGGYQGGMPFFFVFAVVFTAYMLDGWRMLVVALLELMFYTGLCLYAYWYPEQIVPFETEAMVVTDVIVGFVIVSAALGITMYIQTRMYRKQQRELEQARKEAETANEAKSAFLANMSHEVRTPIHMILGMNEILRRGSREEKTKNYSEKIEETGKMLLSLVDSVLDVSKIESGKMELTTAPYSTKELTDILALIGKTQCSKKNLEFHLELDEKLPEYLVGDLGHIRQIASNLLSNAAKYTERGSVTLKIEERPSQEERTILLFISVADTGTGIRKEDQENLFRAFTRLDTDSHQQIEGTGLGLTIVKKLSELMGGQIRVDSVYGEGSTFSVELPQKLLAPGEETKRSEADFLAPGARLLVVDDNEGNRNLMQAFLAPAGIATDLAESGARCLELVQKNAYDAILMDYMMPDMSGLETLQKLKKLPQFHTPVIALTADAGTETEKRLLRGGFAAFLTKPISRKQLLRAILNYLPTRLIQPAPVKKPTQMDQHLAEKLQPCGVILEEGLRYFEGDAEEYKKTAGLFYRYAAEELKTVEELYRKGDYEKLRYSVHTLKGKARNMGMERLSETAAYVESLCARKETEEARSLMPFLLYLGKLGMKGLKIAAGELPPQERPRTVYENCLETLGGFLKDCRRKPSLDCIATLLEQEQNPEKRKLLETMTEQVRQISFREAEETFRTYKEENG